MIVSAQHASAARFTHRIICIKRKHCKYTALYACRYPICLLPSISMASNKSPRQSNIHCSNQIAVLVGLSISVDVEAFSFSASLYLSLFLSHTHKHLVCWVFTLKRKKDSQFVLAIIPLNHHSCTALFCLACFLNIGLPALSSTGLGKSYSSVTSELILYILWSLHKIAVKQAIARAF